jgi:uncharacterized protein YjiS (DUF1127 family)
VSGSQRGLFERLARSRKLRSYRQLRAAAEALTDAELADMGLKRYQLGHVARVRAFKP